MIKKLSDHAIEISKEGRSKLTLNKTGNKVSVNIRGPKGGNEQAMLVDGDDLLEALEIIGGISETASWAHVEKATDSKCTSCADDIPNDGRFLCLSCFKFEERFWK